MTQTDDISPKPKKRKRLLMIIIASVAALLLTLLIVIYFRVNPKWKAAELTIEQSEKTRQINNVDPEGDTVQTRIQTPDGFKRTEVEQGSFGEYIRDYKMLPHGTKLPVYDGTTLSSAGAAAIFDISLGDDGYQQCADSIIRLYSDYYYENGQYDKITFQFSNGDECSYERWRKGKRMLVFGEHSFEIQGALPDDSEQQYRNYLKEVMNYAGTISLQKESSVISADELKIGDFICNDSHVVMVVDVAENEKGEKIYLFGQSFIPSVCFHIIANGDGEQADAWFTQQIQKDSFRVGEYSFKKSDIRRWKDGF